MRIVISVRVALERKSARPKRVALGGPAHEPPPAVFSAIPNESIALLLIW